MLRHVPVQQRPVTIARFTKRRDFFREVFRARAAAAAARLKISYATARQHAKSILSKTGTTRQTELIRRFFETAMPGALAKT